MTATRVPPPTASQRRRFIALGLVPAAVITALLIAVYYLAPLDHLNSVPLGVSLTVGVLLLIGLAAYEVHAITRAKYPGARALRSLATITPFFLILFAAAYYLLANDDPANFGNESLTRSDTLYFTVTTFTTVGFGDIVARSQTARLIVTVQMILDLIFIGFGIRAFIGAFQIGRQRQSAEQDPATPATP